jgi:hypothetical protein
MLNVLRIEIWQISKPLMRIESNPSKDERLRNGRGKGVEPCCAEKFGETLPALPPGSEQFKLQQRRAIETSGALLLERAFLQQSGTLLSGQELSP